MTREAGAPNALVNVCRVLVAEVVEGATMQVEDTAGVAAANFTEELEIVRLHHQLHQKRQ